MIAQQKQAHERAVSAAKKIGSELQIAGAVAVGVLGEAVKAGAEFETMLNNVRANTTMTTAEFDQMSAAVKRMGVESGASFEQLGDGFRYIMSFGGNASKAVELLREAMKSAVSTGDDVGKTADARDAGPNTKPRVSGSQGIGAAVQCLSTPCMLVHQEENACSQGNTRGNLGGVTSMKIIFLSDDRYNLLMAKLTFTIAMKDVCQLSIVHDAREILEEADLEDPSTVLYIDMEHRQAEYVRDELYRRGITQKLIVMIICRAAYITRL